MHGGTHDRLIVATTTPEPTAGLVFYDLKSALHALDGQAGTGEPTVVWQADGGASGWRCGPRSG
jgi:hypothetical protein